MERERQKRTRKKKKKKKSRIGYYLYAVVVMILTTAILLLSVLLLFHVQKIEVEGTKYSEEKQISDWIQEDPYTSNTIYAFCKFKMSAYEKPVYLERVDVGFSAPWILRIKVKEKEIAGGIAMEGGYVYFAKDNTVLVRGTELLEGIPVVEGVAAEQTELYQKLDYKENPKVFFYIRELTKQLKKTELKPERILWDGESMNLYFQGVCVRLGKGSFDEKLIQIPPILEKLEGKTGVLKMEYYSETSTSISFREEVVENE